MSPAIRVITIDTGRLPEETFQMIETVRGHYGLSIEVVAPETSEVESMVHQNGPNLFYSSVPQRMLCCQVRKVRALAKKLEDLRAYAVGLRRSQTAARFTQPKIEANADRIKICPLADWTERQVRDYTLQHDVPRHPLYEKGYRSIGCAPCMRPTRPDEDERAGRWWWEADSKKECGLHFSPSGKVERTVDVLLRQVLDTSHA
jgi:phosphoadenylyl-sulfate reductase (thioredoxin)